MCIRDSLKAKLYLFQLKTRSLYIAAVGSNHYMELAGFVYILYVVCLLYTSRTEIEAVLVRGTRNTTSRTGRETPTGDVYKRQPMA